MINAKNNIKQIIYSFYVNYSIMPCASGGIWTPNHRIISQVFYHCAAIIGE